MSTSTTGPEGFDFEYERGTPVNNRPMVVFISEDEKGAAVDRKSLTADDVMKDSPHSENEELDTFRKLENVLRPIISQGVPNLSAGSDLSDDEIHQWNLAFSQAQQLLDYIDVRRGTAEPSIAINRRTERLNICQSCDRAYHTLNRIRCKECECFMELKVSFPGAECPIGKW